MRWSWPNTDRAVFAGKPGTPSSSSCEAARKRSAEPKCCRIARRRAGSDPVDRVEDRLEGARVALLPVERDREPVGLVADPLEQLQPGVVTVEQDRLRPTRHEHLLLPLRQRDHGDPRQPRRRLHRLEGRRQLPLAAVDHDEVRDGREALVVPPGVARVAQAREAAGDHLPHRREVVLAVEPSDRERAVVRLLRLGVDEHRHRGDDVAALQVRDVEALDP